MRIPWAIQGPGPITLAYRASLSLRHQHTAQDRRPAPTSKPDKARAHDFGLRRDVPSRAAPTPAKRSSGGHRKPREDSKNASGTAFTPRDGQGKPSSIGNERKGHEDEVRGGEKRGAEKAENLPREKLETSTAGQETSKKAKEKKKGTVAPIVFDFTDTREDRRLGETEPPRSARAQTLRKGASTRTDFTTMPSTLPAGRAVDDSGNFVGVDVSMRKRVSTARPTTTSLPSQPDAHEQDLYHDSLSPVPQLPEYVPNSGPIRYARASTSTFDRLELSQRHRELLRIRHHDQAIPSNDYVPIFAPAPPEHRQFAPHLAGFREAARKEDLLQMVSTYSRLGDWHSIDQFNTEDWADASRLVSASIRSQYAANTVGDMLRNRPAVYGGLADMALESAVRDHWEGLYRLMLALVRLGEPKRVVTLYERYRQRLLQHQNRSSGDLHSWDRAARLAARVEGEGIKPMSTVHLAALVMLEDVNGPTLAQMFGTRTNWRAFDRETVQEVISILRKVRRSDTEGLVTAFQTAVSHFILAILCHHPNALSERIKELYSSNSWSQFEGLWTQILAGSIGSKRIIRPLDLSYIGKGETEADVTVTRGVWGKLLRGSSRSQC